MCPLPIELSENDFLAIERAGKLELLPDQREAICRALERHQRATDYAETTGPQLVSAMRRHRRFMGALANFLEELDGYPGHLGHHIAARAGIDSQCEIRRLRALATATDEFMADSAEHNRRHKTDRSLAVLLFDLEDIFLEASGGASTSVISWTGTRSGRFVDFCNSILRQIPKYRRIDVGSRWSTIRRLRTENGGLGWHNWFGKAPPPLLRPTRPGTYANRE